MTPGTLDPRVSFTRAAGPATYFDASGVLRTAATNLWLYSADASNAAWVTAGAAVPTVTANQTAAPDGTLTAARVVYPAVSGTSASVLYQLITVSAAVYTYSMYLKGAVGGEQLYLGYNAGGVYGRVRVTLTTAWQRFVLVTGTLTSAAWVFDVGTDLGDAGQSPTPAQTIYVWGAQLEKGSAASPYIPTTTAANGAPRWDYDPVTHALRGVLIEEARTNFVLNSGDESNPSWLVAGSVVAAPVATANQTLAPDGTMTAARIVYPAVAGTNALSVVYQNIALAAGTYAFSAYLKGSVGGERVWLSAAGWGSGPVATLTTQWQRFVFITAALPAATFGFQIGIDLRDGAQTSTPAQTIYVWGAQVEAGAFATSYIPTTAAAVTRAADSCVIPSANMGWFVSSGSWFAEFICLNPAPPSQRVIGYPTANNRTQIYVNSANEAATFDGASLVITSNALTTGAVSKAASAWAPNVASVCLNGSTVASGAMTTGFSDAAAWGTGIMQYGVTPDGMTGYMRRMRYWPRVLTNTELQSVTR